MLVDVGALVPDQMPAQCGQPHFTFAGLFLNASRELWPQNRGEDSILVILLFIWNTELASGAAGRRHVLLHLKT